MYEYSDIHGLTVISCKFKLQASGYYSTIPLVVVPNTFVCASMVCIHYTYSFMYE